MTKLGVSLFGALVLGGTVVTLWLYSLDDLNQAYGRSALVVLVAVVLAGSGYLVISRRRRVDELAERVSLLASRSALSVVIVGVLVLALGATLLPPDEHIWFAGGSGIAVIGAAASALILVVGVIARFWIRRRYR